MNGIQGGLFDTGHMRGRGPFDSGPSITSYLCYILLAQCEAYYIEYADPNSMNWDSDGQDLATNTCYIINIFIAIHMLHSNLFGSIMHV